MLVLDSSGSMQATDVSPNRLDAARNAAKTFAGRLPDKFRLGFVSFNNVASLLVPPTSDREPVTQALDGLQAEGGTAIGSGLEAALTGLQPVIQRERAEAREEAQREGRRSPPRKPPGGRGAALGRLLHDGAEPDDGRAPGARPRRAGEHGRARDQRGHGHPQRPARQHAHRAGAPGPRDAAPHRAHHARAVLQRGRREEAATVYDRLGSRIGFRKEKREYTAAFAAGGLGLMLAGGCCR